MAHVHGTAAVTKAVNTAGKARELADSAKVAKGMGGMMGGMGEMGGMGMGSGPMGGMMGGMGMGSGHMMANMPKATEVAALAGKAAARGAATGGAVAAGSQAGRSFLPQLARHPWVIFGLGVAAGFLIYKYRKTIIGTTVRATRKTGEEA